MAQRNPHPNTRPLQPQAARPLGGSLSISLTRFLETVAARKRLLAERMPQPSPDAERQAGSLWGARPAADDSYGP